MARKPMRLMRSDEEYREFLLSIKGYQRDLREGKKLPVDELEEYFEPFYAKLTKRQVADYCSWLYCNRVKIVLDMDKMFKHGAHHIRAPENEKRHAHFRKYVDAIMAVCETPEDFHDVVKKRAIEVAEVLYSKDYGEKKLMSIKTYMQRNYDRLQKAIENEFSD